MDAYVMGAYVMILGWVAIVMIGAAAAVCWFWFRRASTPRDQETVGPSEWRPIGTAPTDNKIPLYLARFDESGELVELDFDGEWRAERESWELPEIYHYWASAGGIENPTHWAYPIIAPRRRQPSDGEHPR